MPKRPTLKAAYSVAELAELAGLSRWQIYRLIKRTGMRTIKGQGTKELVPLVAFRDAMPDLYASMLERMAVRPDDAAKCEACGSVVDAQR